MPLKVNRESARGTRRLTVGTPRSKSLSRPPQSPPAPEPTTEAPVYLKCVQGDDAFCGVKVGEKGGEAIVRLCIPTPDGQQLIKSATQVQIPLENTSSLEVSVPVVERGIKGFNLVAPFTEEVKAMKVEDGDVIVDYRDVTVEGMASTFENVTPYDHEGDRVLAGAFDHTLARFKKNPVMLLDHIMSVPTLAGSFTRLSVIDSGLAVQGKVSNSPDMKSVRFKIVEGHLKAFSIGGFFFFQDGDYHAIEEVELFEISLVAVPMNPDALFTSRSVNIADACKMFRKHFTLHAA